MGGSGGNPSASMLIKETCISTSERQLGVEGVSYSSWKCPETCLQKPSLGGIS